jgi:hypothetical protein
MSTILLDLNISDETGIQSIPFNRSFLGKRIIMQEQQTLGWHYLSSRQSVQV